MLQDLKKPTPVLGNAEPRDGEATIASATNSVEAISRRLAPSGPAAAKAKTLDPRFPDYHPTETYKQFPDKGASTSTSSSSSAGPSGIDTNT